MKFRFFDTILAELKSNKLFFVKENECCEIPSNTYIIAVETAIKELKWNRRTSTLDSFFKDLSDGILRYKADEKECNVCTHKRVSSEFLEELEAELNSVPNKIKTIGYERPEHYPIITDIVGKGIVGVFDTTLNGNTLVFKLNVEAAINFGDGEIKTIAANTVVEHTYPDGVYKIVISVSSNASCRYYQNFRHGTENLYVKGLNEIYIYGQWDELAFQHSAIVYYEEKEEQLSANMVARFERATNLKEVVATFAALTADAYAIFLNCYSFKKEDILRIFNNLPSVTDSQRFDIRNTAGAGLLTDAEVQIATDKGWTVLK